jgi:hypothetical protein
VYDADLISGYEFNRTIAWEAPAPQPHTYGGGYTMVSLFHAMLGMFIRLFCRSMKPSLQYENLGQGETNYAGYDLTANQFPGYTTPFQPHLTGAYTAPNSQGVFPAWHLLDCWVSYAVQDELHVTIALRRIPNPSPDRFHH